MRVIDVDSHFMEPIDWLEQVDPALAKEIPPSDESFIERVVQGVVGDLLAAAYPAARSRPWSRRSGCSSMRSRRPRST